jgi:hypothetical protein
VVVHLDAVTAYIERLQDEADLVAWGNPGVAEEVYFDLRQVREFIEYARKRIKR